MYAQHSVKHMIHILLCVFWYTNTFNVLSFWY